MLSSPSSKVSGSFPLPIYDFIPQEHEDASQIQMQGATISLRTFARYLEDLLGRERLRISGELTLEELTPLRVDGTSGSNRLDGQILRVAVRVGTSPAREHARRFVSPSFPTALDTLLCQAAQDVYRNTQPALLAFYLLHRGQLEEAQEAIEACLANSDDTDDVLALLLWGDVLLRKNLPDAAAEKYRSAKELAPKQASVFVNYGSALLQAHHLDEAEASLQRAEALADDIPSLHIIWSFLHQERGEREAAVDRLERATQVDPEYVQGWFYWAKALLKYNRPTEARRKIERALAVHPSYPPALLLLGTMAESEEQRNEIHRRLEEIGRREAQAQTHRCPV